MTQEPNLVAGRDALGAGEYLETNLVLFQPDHLGQGCAVVRRNNRQIVVTNALCLNGYDIAGYFGNLIVKRSHY